MTRYKRRPTATITFDYLWDESDEAAGRDDEVGKAWHLYDQAVYGYTATGTAYDDDGERYYKVLVFVPTDERLHDEVLGNLLSILMRHAGVTRIDFSGRPELNVG